MTLTGNLIAKQNRYYLLKIIVTSLIIIALVSEFLPEFKAKTIVVPTLIILLIMSIAEVIKLHRNS